MTKQEEIREVIDIYADDGCNYPDKTCGFFKGGYCVAGREAYRCLMKRLDELGVVIKVDGELPKNPHFSREDISSYGLGMMNGFDQALKEIAGYVAVEPLVKEQ